MRFFALLMALIMLFVCLDVCRDSDETCVSKPKVEISKKSKGMNEPDKACSPFCSCVRCPFSILIPATYQLSAIHISIASLYICEAEGRPVPISETVWQPPRLA